MEVTPAEKYVRELFRRSQAGHVRRKAAARVGLVGACTLAGFVGALLFAPPAPELSYALAMGGATFGATIGYGLHGLYRRAVDAELEVLRGIVRSNLLGRGLLLAWLDQSDSVKDSGASLALAQRQASQPTARVNFVKHIEELRINYYTICVQSGLRPASLNTRWPESLLGLALLLFLLGMWIPTVVQFLGGVGASLAVAGIALGLGTSCLAPQALDKVGLLDTAVGLELALALGAATEDLGAHRRELPHRALEDAKL